MLSIGSPLRPLSGACFSERRADLGPAVWQTYRALKFREFLQWLCLCNGLSRQEENEGGRRSLLVSGFGLPALSSVPMLAACGFRWGHRSHLTRVSGEALVPAREGVLATWPGSDAKCVRKKRVTGTWEVHRDSRHLHFSCRAQIAGGLLNCLFRAPRPQVRLPRRRGFGGSLLHDAGELRP